MIKNVVTSESVPIKMWLDDLEEGALQQAKNLANLPFAFKHIAIMPDSHQGYGMPIGGVLATQGAVVPNAVGVDIGCGIMATKTNIKEIDRSTLEQITEEIKSRVPVGFKKHEQAQDIRHLPSLEGSKNVVSHVVHSGREASRNSIGTLGGGNHFIEIQMGDDGHVWIMIHSGSREVGKNIATHYDEIAKALNEKYHSVVPKEYDLAFFPALTLEYEDYITDMNYAVEFAHENRKLMMANVYDAFRASGVNPKIMDGVHIGHNYARMENHFGQNVMVHRKGATSAREGERGIIPGSQGTNSYITIGKGEKQSFTSCAHGAGRKLGRKHAQRTLDLEEEKKKLDDLGVVHAMEDVKHLDEAPGAYKDVHEVMENQKDLIDIEVTLTPLAVVKG